MLKGGRKTFPPFTMTSPLGEGQRTGSTGQQVLLEGTLRSVRAESRVYLYNCYWIRHLIDEQLHC